MTQEDLDDAVARMTPAARATFDDVQERGHHAEPHLAAGFDALSSSERASVTDSAQLVQALADAQAVEQKRTSRRHRRLWIASGLFPFVCLIALSGILIRVYTAPTKPDPADAVVTTPDQVARYLADHVPAPMPGGRPPIFIPTGLLIESVELTGPYTVEVSGQIWQRYADDVPKDISRGIFLPLAKDQPTLKELYRERRGNEEVVGWTFHAMMREQFDYSRYPMGRHQIRLRMFHPDFEQGVYLVPDLAAYNPIDPTAVPGVDPTMVLENWDIQQAFFSYRTHDLKTDFGLRDYRVNQQYPELYYSIAVRRHLMSPLISRTIVPIVILIQLFVIVMVLGKDDDRLEKFGVRPGTVIFTAAAFFFAVLIGHNSLRDEVKSPGFIYIESLYLITYVVIVSVVVNAFLLVGRPHLRLFRDYDNLWVKVLYWPFVLAAMLAFTLVKFSGLL